MIGGGDSIEGGGGNVVGEELGRGHVVGGGDIIEGLEGKGMLNVVGGGEGLGRGHVIGEGML